TLSSWIEHLRSLADDPPPALTRFRRYLEGRDVPAPVLRFLGEPLRHRAPTRMANWAERHGISTFDELLRREPRSLLEERNLGQQSLLQTHELVRKATGMSWERIRELLLHDERAPLAAGGAAPARDVVTAPSWDALEDRCSPELLALPNEKVALPSRMLRFLCEPHGIGTLGELLAWREEDLREVPNLGARTVRDA